jgi:outer membrane biosynthesis protein TonB
MTPPAAATGHRSRKLRRSSAPRSPRRVSGPTRPPRAALAGAGGAAVARPPLSLRLGRRAMRVGDARVLDRLVRGRAWIAIVAAALIGIVFMQVSMLKLNAGVSRAVTAADTLERQNSSLRADISKLDSGERVQDAAANLGMTTRPAGDVRYLDAERASAARAAASIKPPSPVAPVAPTAQQQAPVTQQQAPVVQQQAPAAQAAATQQQAPATQQQAPATQQQAPATQQQAPATQQQAPVAQQQATTTQQGAATTNTAPPATGTTNQAGSVAGGATATPGEG